MRNIAKYGLVVAAVAAGTMMGTLTSTRAAESTPPASIIVIDTQLIRQNSLAGKDILRQIDEIRTSVQDEIQKEEDKLRAEEDELKRQRAILTPEAFDQKRQAWEQKVMDVQRKVQEKNAQLEAALQKANGVLQRAILPILQKTLDSKGATFMVDKSQVLIMAPNKGLDVTTQVIEQLDSVLPGVKVDFSAVADAGNTGATAAPTPAPAPAPAANTKKKN
jgi:outer membrane protein